MAGGMFLLLLLALAAGERVPEDACPWCRSDPELLRAAGVVSHGPIPIGAAGSEALVESLPAADWRFLETAHLRFASALGPEAVEFADKKRVRAELARLKAVLPAVPSDPRKLDPWLRLHLLGMKAEELYARFQEVLRVTDADFPETRAPEGPFMGIGRFLGEKDKFEVVLHPTRSQHRAFTTDLSGVSVTDSFRWHFRAHHKLLVSIPAEDADLRHDRWLFPHLAHNLSHAFLCAYKHFSYDPPVWIDEGLAHALEKEIEPESVTTDGTEGTHRETHLPKDWEEAVRRLAARGKATSLPQLLHAKDLGELDADAHLTAWSKVRFLMDGHPDALAAILGGVKGQVDEEGRTTGRNLVDLQRRLLLDEGGWTPQAFDLAWAEWVARGDR